MRQKRASNRLLRQLIEGVIEPHFTDDTLDGVPKFCTCCIMAEVLGEEENICLTSSKQQEGPRLDLVGRFAALIRFNAYFTKARLKASGFLSVSYLRWVSIYQAELGMRNW